jgi:signal transduction histidine kinase
MKTTAPDLFSVFEQLADGICLSSRGSILYLNSAAQRLMGVALDQARGHSLCRLLCGHMSASGRADCAARCILRDPSGAEKAVTFDGRYVRRAFGWHEPEIDRIENVRELRVRCMRTLPWPDRAQSDTHLTVIEDVTARETLEKEREDWRNMIAHDLRSPLSNIYASLRMMQENLERGDPEKPDAEMVGIGVNNCRRMIELIDLYLEVSKMDAGTASAEIEELDLSRIASRCAEEQSPLARERRIALVVDVPAGLKVMADEQLLTRVVQNLVNNALKYTPEGGRVELSAALRGRNAVQACVADTGPGIAREEIPHLFDRYHQAKARREGRIKGTGLGLAFCRQALTMMKGDIRAESKPGEGSRFVFRLPAPLKKRMNHERRSASPGVGAIAARSS